MQLVGKTPARENEVKSVLHFSSQMIMNKQYILSREAPGACIEKLH